MTADDPNDPDDSGQEVGQGKDRSMIESALGQKRTPFRSSRRLHQKCAILPIYEARFATGGLLDETNHCQKAVHRSIIICS